MYARLELICPHTIDLRGSSASDRKKKTTKVVSKSVCLSDLQSDLAIEEESCCNRLKNWLVTPVRPDTALQLKIQWHLGRGSSNRKGARASVQQISACSQRLLSRAEAQSRLLASILHGLANHQ